MPHDESHDTGPGNERDRLRPNQAGWEDAVERDVIEALSPSFRLTTAFLRQHPRYRHTLSLTPENFRFDPVLWHSSIAALRAMLSSVADDRDIAVSDDDLDEAVRNLVEGIVLRSRAWDG